MNCPRFWDGIMETFEEFITATNASREENEKDFAEIGETVKRFYGVRIIKR